MSKNVLLIGGGGTLGYYVAKELNKVGVDVDIIALETPTESENFKYFNFNADYDGLEKFLQGRYYDGIVNFIHYPNVDGYPRIHTQSN